MSIVAAFDLLVYGLGIPILPIQSAALGLDIADTGLLFAAFAGTQVFALIWALTYASRIAPGRLLGVGVVCCTAAAAIFALSAEWVPGLVAGRMVHGVGSALCWVAGPALVSALYADAERGGALGTVLAVGAVGSLAGPLLGGALYDWGGFPAPFWLATAIGVALIGALISPVGRALARLAAQGGASPGAAILGLLRDGRVIAVLVFLGCATAGLGLIEGMLPAVMHETLGTSGLETGVIFGVAVLCYGLCAPGAGRLSDRVGRVPVSVGGLLLMAVGFALLPLGTTQVAIGAVACVLGVALGFALTPTMPALAEAVERQGTGDYTLVYALHSIVYAAGLFTGPSLGGQGIARHGLTVTLAVVCAVTAAAALLGWGVDRRARARSAAR